MVGMRDVAKKAGVSLSTVSLVVNGNGYVSDDMRERVRKAMQLLNYVPNELARNLYHDRTNWSASSCPPSATRSLQRLPHICSMRSPRKDYALCCALPQMRRTAKSSMSTCCVGT